MRESPYEAPFKVDPASDIPLLDERLNLCLVTGRQRVQRVGGRLIIRLPFESAGEHRHACARRLVSRWLRLQAEARLPERLNGHAATHGFRPGPVTIRAYKRRWGSCFKDGRIGLNWRLIMLPSVIADSVILHELCHLIHHNHSPRFYEELHRCNPQWRRHRKWLQNHGCLLPF